MTNLGPPTSVNDRGEALLRFRSGSKRANWAVGGLVAAITASLWAIGADVSRLRVASQLQAREAVSLGSAGTSDTLVRVTGLVVLVIEAAALVAFLMWLHRAVSNASRLGSRSMEFSPAWAVGWFFVPFANLVKPFQVLKELWLESDLCWTSDRRPDGSSPAHFPLIPVWWGLWLVSAFSNVAVAVAYGGGKTLSDLGAGAIAGIVNSALYIAAWLTTVVLIRRIQTRQTAQVAMLSALAASAPGPSGLAATSIPVPAPPKRSPAWRAAIAAAAAAVLAASLTVGIVVGSGTGKRIERGATSTGSTWFTSNARFATCSDDLFKPTVPPSAGLSSACAHVRLGTVLLAAICNGPALPSGLVSGVFDAGNPGSDLGAVQAGAGACLLSTKSSDIAASVWPGAGSGPTFEPANLIVVADFVPSADPVAVDAVTLRTTPADELAVAVRGDGAYQITEFLAQTHQILVQGQLNVPAAPSINLGAPVRLLVEVNGTTAAVYIDGRLIGSGPTEVPNVPGGMDFELDSLGATHPVVVKLIDLYAFAAG
jgi:hypothetical protein